MKEKRDIEGADKTASYDAEISHYKEVNEVSLVSFWG